MDEQPPSKKSLHPWPLNVLEGEWPRVKGAPWSFCLVALVFLLLGAGAIHLLYSTFIIPGKDATIMELSDSPKASDDTSIQGAEIDQSKEVIELRAEIKNQHQEFDDLKKHSFVDQGYSDPDEWPALTDAQISEWANAIAPYHVHLFEISLSGTETEKLGKSLFKLADELKCPVPIMDQNYMIKGILITTAKNDPVGPILLGLFKTAGYPDVTLEMTENAPAPVVSSVLMWIGETK